MDEVDLDPFVPVSGIFFNMFYIMNLNAVNEL